MDNTLCGQFKSRDKERNVEKKMQENKLFFPGAKIELA